MDVRITDCRQSDVDRAAPGDPLRSGVRPGSAASLLPYPQWSRATLPGAPARHREVPEKVEAVTERHALPRVR